MKIRIQLMHLPYNAMESQLLSMVKSRRALSNRNHQVQQNIQIILKRKLKNDFHF